MGMMGGKSMPSTPQMAQTPEQPAVEEAPTVTETPGTDEDRAALAEAEAEERRRKLMAQGRTSTLLTNELESPATGTTTLLGG